MKTLFSGLCHHLSTGKSKQVWQVLKNDTDGEQRSFMNYSLAQPWWGSTGVVSSSSIWQSLGRVGWHGVCLTYLLLEFCNGLSLCWPEPCRFCGCPRAQFKQSVLALSILDQVLVFASSLINGKTKSCPLWRSRDVSRGKIILFQMKLLWIGGGAASSSW